MKIVKQLFLPIKNIIYPPRCIFCRRMLSISADNNICEHCMKKLPFCLPLQSCPKCGRPIPEGAVLCYRCGKGFSPAYGKVSAVYLYEGVVRQALLRFKRERYRGYGDAFAMHMSVAIQKEFPHRNFDCLVAVPPRKKKIRRGNYDQADALASALAREMKIPYLRRALRQKEVRAKQSSLDFEERWANVMDNYEVVRKKDVAGKRILLVDDICTTGATLNECAKMLKKSGTLEVSCAVVAIAPEKIF